MPAPAKSASTLLDGSRERLGGLGRFSHFVLRGVELPTLVFKFEDDRAVVLEFEPIEPELLAFNLLARSLLERLGKLGCVERGLLFTGLGVDEHEPTTSVGLVDPVPEAGASFEPTRPNAEDGQLVFEPVAESVGAFIIDFGALAQNRLGGEAPEKP